MTNSPFEIALQFARPGISVIPSGAPGKDGKLKAPAVRWKQYQNTRPTLEQIQQWENEKHPSLWGMITGPVSGLFGIDTDDHDPDDLHPEALAIMTNAGLKPHTLSRRGNHFYFAYPTDFDLSTKAGILPHVDIRARGGFMNFAGENRDACYQNIILPSLGACPSNILFSFRR